MTRKATKDDKERPAENRKRISVLIVTHNRARGLKRCLEAMAAQTVIPDEVVVVDNGSVDRAQEIIAAYSGRLALKYTFFEKPSIPAARNSALRNASNGLVLFVDDDCVADSRLIEEAFRADRAFPEAAVIQGRVLGYAGSISGKAIQVHYDVYFQRCYFLDKPHGYLKYIWTSNALFRKDQVLQANGWFDESILLSEDRELGMRLIRLGLSIRYYPLMMVTHEYDGRSLRGMCAAAWARAEAKAHAGFAGESTATALFLLKDMFCRVVEEEAFGCIQKIGIIAINVALYCASWLGGVCGYVQVWFNRRVDQWRR